MIILNILIKKNQWTKKKWFNRIVNWYLNNLIKKKFKNTKKYTYHQTKYILAIKKKGARWSHVIRLKKIPSKDKVILRLHKNYTYRTLFETEKFKVLEMIWKGNK